MRWVSAQMLKLCSSQPMKQARCPPHEILETWVLTASHNGLTVQLSRMRAGIQPLIDLKHCSGHQIPARYRIFKNINGVGHAWSHGAVVRLITCNTGFAVSGQSQIFEHNG